MIFKQFTSGACRSYLIGNEGGKDVILIDPHADFVPQYLQALEQNHYRLTHVIDTHTHADHVSGAVILQKETGCAYLMHKASPVKPVSEHMQDGFKLDVSGVELAVLYTPGHSQDSISLILPEKILTGDTLFLDEGGAGRDDLYGGDAGEHWESLQRIGSLSDTTMIYPAHDYKSRLPSTLGEQKTRNPHLRYKSKASYIVFSQEQKFGIVPWMDRVVQTNIVGATEPVQIVPANQSNTCEAQNPCEPIGQTLPAGVTMITAENLKIQLTNSPQPILLDVREADELVGELGQLEGIIHIPLGELLDRVIELEPYKQTEIISICKKGGRARTAAVLLASAGFSQITILDGGMTAFRDYEKN